MPQPPNKWAVENNPYTYSNENPQGPRNDRRREQGLAPYNAYDDNYKKSFWTGRKGSHPPSGTLPTLGWWGDRKKWEKNQDKK